MATGMAKGASLRSKRIAFGDGLRIRWDQHSETIFRGNPNIAPPGTENSGGLEWIPFYKGSRIYNKSTTGRWIWNYDFRVTPGEIYLNKEEKTFAEKVGKKFIVMEPNVPMWKSVAPNKQWPFDRYNLVARKLKAQGYDIVQMVDRSPNRIPDARQIGTVSFRRALAVLQRAALYIGPEGGLHHGAAAVGVPGVVLFGGFIPPQITGYDTHTNLTGGVEACGNINRCDHCIAAMKAISVEEVVEAALARVKA